MRTALSKAPSGSESESSGGGSGCSGEIDVDTRVAPRRERVASALVVARGKRKGPVRARPMRFFTLLLGSSHRCCVLKLYRWTLQESGG